MVHQTTENRDGHINSGMEAGMQPTLDRIDALLVDLALSQESERTVPSITPFLWFDNNLDEAITFYQSVFPDSEIIDASRMSPDGPVFTATFELNGQRFMGLNGGPHFKFTEAISMFVSVESQDELDDLWDKLCDGGEESRCGWLKDRFGLSWQIVPTILSQLLGSPDRERAGQAMNAMMQMSKLSIADLQAAYDA